MTNQKAPGEGKRKWTWQIWSGFLLAVAAVPTFAAAGGLLVAGVRSAFANPEVYRGRIVGLILAVLSWGAVGVFAYATLYASRQFARSGGRAGSWGQGAGICACRHERKNGRAFHVALRADAGHTGGKTTRRAIGFLSGILLTVL